MRTDSAIVAYVRTLNPKASNDLNRTFITRKLNKGNWVRAAGDRLCIEAEVLHNAHSLQVGTEQHRLRETDMNASAFNRIADVIEQHPDLYDQGEFGNGLLVDALDGNEECNTPCCIAGFAVALYGAGEDPETPTEVTARKVLELTDGESDALFDFKWPRHWFKRAGIELAPDRIGLHRRLEPTADDAPVVLRAMAQSGKVFPREEGRRDDERNEGAPR